MGLRRSYLIIFFCQTKTTSEFAGQLTLSQPHLSDENHSSSLSVKSSGRKFSKIPSLSSLPQNRRILEWDVLGDEGLHLRRNQSSRPQPPPGTNTEAQCQAAGQVQAPDSQPRDPPPSSHWDHAAHLSGGSGRTEPGTPSFKLTSFRRLSCHPPHVWRGTKWDWSGASHIYPHPCFTLIPQLGWVRLWITPWNRGSQDVEMEAEGKLCREGS